MTDKYQIEDYAIRIEQIGAIFSQKGLKGLKKSLKKMSKEHDLEDLNNHLHDIELFARLFKTYIKG